MQSPVSIPSPKQYRSHHHRHLLPFPYIPQRLPFYLLGSDLVLLSRSTDPERLARRMAEEQRFQEGHRLCTNNCGFFGSPATLDLCSKCYRDHCVKEEQQRQLQDSSGVKVAVESFRPISAPSIPNACPTPSAISVTDQVEDVEKKEDKATAPAAAGPRRCASCRKRVGLTGFPCRCGATYCGTHRYAEKHGCTFDFKAAGRTAIARANPVVKAEKLQKI